MDTALQVMLDGAEEFVERFCGLRFNAAAANAVVSEALDGGMLNLWPKYHPINSITSITNIDSGVAYTSYSFAGTRIYRNDGGMWSIGTNLWRVVYNAGYLSATLPGGLQVCIMQLFGRNYHNTDGAAGETGGGHTYRWEALLDSDIGRRLRTHRVRGGLLG